MQHSSAVCISPPVLCVLLMMTSHTWADLNFLSLDKEGFPEHSRQAGTFLHHLYGVFSIPAVCLSFPLHWKLTPGVHFCVLRPRNPNEFLKSQCEKDYTFLPIIP